MPSGAGNGLAPCRIRPMFREHWKALFMGIGEHMAAAAAVYPSCGAVDVDTRHAPDCPGAETPVNQHRPPLHPPPAR